jgi:protein gp37
MGQTTAIEWCDHTFNPWIGCTRVGDECDHCYAADLAERRSWAIWGPHEARYVTAPSTWRQPLKWHRDAVRDGARRRVFCASLADVFEDRRDLDLPRAWLWALVGATPQLDWLLLTKRPAKVPRLVPAVWLVEWPAHVWIGTSIGCRTSLPQLAYLRAIPAPVRFLSCEPLLKAAGARPARYRLGDRRRRERSPVPAERLGCGARPPRPGEGRGAAVLLQAVGRPDSEGRRQDARRPRVVRGAMTDGAG